MRRVSKKLMRAWTEHHAGVSTGKQIEISFIDVIEVSQQRSRIKYAGHLHQLNRRAGESFHFIKRNTQPIVNRSKRAGVMIEKLPLIRRLRQMG